MVALARAGAARVRSEKACLGRAGVKRGRLERTLRLGDNGVPKPKRARRLRKVLLRLESDRPLGARIEGDTTTFGLFAPCASRVIVSFFKYLDSPHPEVVDLAPRGRGVWEVAHPRSLHGWYYYFQVESSDKGAFGHCDGSFRILDPYALATVGPAGPGIVWDKRKTQLQGRRFHPPPWHDLVIVEAHVRDLLKHAPIDLDEDERLGFSGLTKWVQAEGGYLRGLGVNAVELQPIQEVGDSYPKDGYHWGYMPTNFFSPESSYALCPEVGSQIEELQELVAAFHQVGLAVILDVVYNHVGLPNHLAFVDRHYYFHLDEQGEFTNWSGCGNDLRCDAPMVRRLIIDSLSHLIETYDVDGFRFDLAELLGVEVLREVETAVKKVKPSIILIAEPWSFRGHIAFDLKETGFAFWNDGYRDFLCDYVMGQGNQEGLQYYMRGSIDHLAAWPAQSVNYVESHDDRCWIDKITENPDHRGDVPTPNDRRRTHLLAGVLMSSFGIPMISAGQDTLRTKGGLSNTYRDGDANGINYHRLLHFSATHDYFRKWILFRRSERGRPFRLDSRPAESYLRFFGAEHGSGLAALFNADKSKGPRSLVFAINPHHETAPIPIDGVDLARWRQLADHERFDERGLESARFHFRHGRLELPPLTCGLWEE